MPTAVDLDSLEGIVGHRSCGGGLQLVEIHVPGGEVSRGDVAANTFDLQAVAELDHVLDER